MTTRDPRELLAGPVGTLRGWFDALAHRLLNASELVAGDAVYRLAEIELYYHAADHPDPFSHRTELQLSCGPWYLHRQGPSYRGGSFKGLDLTFGDDAAHGGILLRSLVAADGALTDGPSRVVDRLLADTGHARVAELDAELGGRAAWEAGPLQLRSCADRDRRIHATARVGLTLKRRDALALRQAYILRPYRYLTEPRRIRKGRLQLLLALHQDGLPVAEIVALTGSPRSAARRHIVSYEAGRGAALATFGGVALNPARLAQLHGAWHELQSRP